MNTITIMCRKCESFIITTNKVHAKSSFACPCCTKTYASARIIAIDDKEERILINDKPFFSIEAAKAEIRKQIKDNGKVNDGITITTAYYVVK